MRMQATGRARAAAGVTLLEMLVALGVFAVIGVLSAQILGQMANINERTRARADRLVDLQRAVEIVRRDVQQLAHRYVRDELGDPAPVIDLNQVDLLHFTRRGWANGRGLPRSELQRVAYRLEGDRLYRLFWPVLDRAGDTVPVEQLLLGGVETVEVSAIDVSGDRHGHWPIAGESAGDPERELAALEVRLVVPPWGEIERLWTVPFSGVSEEEGASGDPEEDGDAFEDEDASEDDVRERNFEETRIDALS